MATLDKNLLGMCYYHESMGYNTRTLPQIEADLAIMQQVTSNVKLYHSPWVNAGQVDPATALANCILIAIAAKKLGMYVVLVENNDGAQFTSANWSDYCTKVIADATAVQSMVDTDGTVYSIDEFLVGNEISIHNDGSAPFQDANLPSTIQTLCTSIEPVFRGIIGVQDGWWKAALFAGNLKSIRTLHLTTYRNDQDLVEGFNSLGMDVKDFAKVGSLGEYSTSDTPSKMQVTDQEWADMLVGYWQLAHDYGVFQWLFAYKEQTGYGLVQQTPVDNVPSLAFERLVQLVND